MKLKVSAFYLEKQKSFIPKKKFGSYRQDTYIQKIALAVSIFQKVLLICLTNLLQYEGGAAWPTKIYDFPASL